VSGTGQPSEDRTPWLALSLALAGIALTRRRNLRPLIARKLGKVAQSSIVLSALCVLLFSSSAQAVTLPYSQNFDAFTICSNSCSVLCPLSESWTNAVNNDTDWRSYSGPTTSSGTGPSSDHTSGNGNYLYIESSVPCNPSYEATMWTPPLDLTAAVNPVAGFYYHIYGADLGTLHIDILDANQIVIQQDVIPVLGGNDNSWRKTSIDLNPYKGQTIHIQFRGVTGGGFESDIAIDDLLVEDAVPDVGVTAITGPVSGSCGDSAGYIEVEVTNFGAAVKDVPVAVTLSGAVSQMASTTIMGDFGLDAKQKVLVGPVDLFAGGDIDIAATTSLPTDTNNGNDETTGKVNLLAAAITVTPPSASVCPGNQAVFQAKLESATNFEWFDMPQEGNLLGTGPVFAAPGSLMTTSYYVGRVPTVAQGVGPKDPLFGNTLYLSNQGGKLHFETLAAMTLKGVYVYPQNEGTVHVNLRDEFGVTILASKTQVIGPADVAAKTWVELNFYVPAGKFSLDNAGSEMLLRCNIENVVYPYVSTFLEIQDFTFNGTSYPTYYAYFYDWQVANFVCSARTKVDLVADGSLCDADLVTQVSGPATASAGGDIQYTIIVRNNGPTGAYGVTVNDTPPEGFTHVSNSGDCDGAFPCDVGAIQPGESQNFKASYTIAPNVTGTVQFKATVTSSSSDPDPTNNEGSAETLIESESDIELQLTANAETIGVGADAVLRLHVINHGPATASATKITADIPTGLTLVSTSGCDNDPSAVPECELGQLDPGAEKIVLVTATADADAPRVVSYSATLSSDTVDPAPGKETSSLNIVINRGEPGEVNIVAARSPGCSCHVVGQPDGKNTPTPWGLVGLGLAAMAAAFRRRRVA
ncbi:MAG: MYXO-CTERM sorting domain-containing protein, partial [Polyangiaceae bacterium]